MTEVEQDFVRHFLFFKRDFCLNLDLLVNEVKHEIPDLVNCDHTRGARIILLPKTSKSFKSFIAYLLLLIEKFASKTLEDNRTKEIEHHEVNNYLEDWEENEG